MRRRDSVFSGIQPTGGIHLGNLLGAIRGWVEHQDSTDSVFCIVDLHALTVAKEPGELGARTLELAQVLMACGLDPDSVTLFVQSHVHQHAELAWVLQCNTSFGELSRMTQFKDKSARQRDFVSAGLFTYPSLQAADILLYDTEQVPVGEDQRQHIELTRDVAERFNARFGETFVLPEAVVPLSAARDGPAEPNGQDVQVRRDRRGTILLDDDPARARRRSAVRSPTPAARCASTPWRSPGCRTCWESWVPARARTRGPSPSDTTSTVRSRPTPPTLWWRCSSRSRSASPSCGRIRRDHPCTAQGGGQGTGGGGAGDAARLVEPRGAAPGLNSEPRDGALRGGRRRQPQAAVVGRLTGGRRLPGSQAAVVGRCQSSPSVSGTLQSSGAGGARGPRPRHARRCRPPRAGRAQLGATSGRGRPCG
ncbi:MAG: tryptophan--tRNA ligase [Microthrixaceae bacterium]